MLESFDNEVKALKRELMRYCWYMRGGLTYDQALDLSPTERTLVGDVIKDNLEVAKKTGQPFF